VQVGVVKGVCIYIYIYMVVGFLGGCGWSFHENPKPENLCFDKSRERHALIVILYI
jgi:hypothetical protein